MTAKEKVVREKVSIVIPLFNEEECVNELYKRIKKEIDEITDDYEIIFVDDGSTDKTFELLQKLNSADKKVKVIKFRENFGQTPAISAGIDFASGDIIITMDGDLQNDPEDFRNMIEKLEEGYDVVSGWRFDRQDDFITRKVPSIVANRLLSWITGTKLHDYGCSLKVYRASVLKPLHLYSEMHRFIPAFCAFIGGKVTEMKVKHHPRLHGKTKYGLGRIWRVLADLLKIQLLIRFSKKPLIWFFSVGSIFLIIGIIFGFVTLLGGQHFNEGTYLVVHVGTSLLFILLFVFLISLGILGELINQFQEPDPSLIYNLNLLENYKQKTER